MSKWVVIDTNVLLVAEGQSSYSRVCKANCGAVLATIKSKKTVVLDTGREILTEYGRKLAQSKRQPGLGYLFWKWLVNTQVSHRRCEFVNLTKHPNKGYEEFPDHEALKDFDPADRKFVAVASSHPNKPWIVQAGDSKWWGWRDALKECGVSLDLPCEAELKAKWEAKFASHAS